MRRLCTAPGQRARFSERRLPAAAVTTGLQGRTRVRICLLVADRADPEQLRLLAHPAREANCAARPRAAAALHRLLVHGERFCAAGADVNADQLRAWSLRLTALVCELADTIDAPVRNRVQEALLAPQLPPGSALRFLRERVSYLSVRDIAAEAGVSARTIERVESGHACRASVARAIAAVYALGTLELFWLGADSDALRCRSPSELRDALETRRRTA
jgi:helix-turn-helix protein